MTFYAEQPVRRALQVAGDLGVVGWTVAWVLLARVVHGAVMAATAPGRRLADVGTTIESGMTEAGATAAGVPVVGSRLQDPFDRVAATGEQLRQAGDGVVDLVGTLAVVLALLVALVPVLAVVVPWAGVRLHYARRTGSLRRLAESPGGADLLALRALAHQRPERLRAVGPDPLRSWREGDATVTGALADLELGRWGLRPRHTADAAATP